MQEHILTVPGDPLLQGCVAYADFPVCASHLSTVCVTSSLQLFIELE